MIWSVKTMGRPASVGLSILLLMRISLHNLGINWQE